MEKTFVQLCFVLHNKTCCAPLGVESGQMKFSKRAWVPTLLNALDSSPCVPDRTVRKAVRNLGG